MARRRKEEDNGPKGNEWLSTYSDMVTLVMTLFILLYSMSTVDKEKLQSISKAFSELSGKSVDSVLQDAQYNNNNNPIIGGESNNTDQDESTQAQAMYQDIKKFIQENKLDNVIDLAQNDKGIVLQLKDNILFDSGEADLKSDSNEILDKINTIISTIPNSIVIEGHTDNVPIHNEKYKDNWDLSSMRAANVLRYFTEIKHQDPKRFSAAGYGEYKPKVDNSTEENRAQNRRVNILIENND